MRFLLFILLGLAASLAASEPVYPLWDGHESIADYAKRVDLPPTKTLDLGGGVKLELLLIPAGKFIMGTGTPEMTEPPEPPEPPAPEPLPVDEDGFRNHIFMGQWLLAVSAIALLLTLCLIIVVTIRKRQRPKYSGLWLLLMVAIAGGSALYWRQSVRKLEEARAQYTATQDVARAQYAAAKEAARAQYTAAKERFEAARAQARLDSAVSEDGIPSRPETLTQPFYMGKFVVTQEQYQQVIGKNPSHFIGKDNPVEEVPGFAAIAFCEKVTEQSKQMVRLPTETEWEYACRAGTTSTYYSGDTEADLGRVAWYAGNSKNTTHPVGQKEPNRFGLYDMLGNVLQWSSDYPTGGFDRIFHLCRGGGYDLSPDQCRSAYRPLFCLATAHDDIGFRVVVPAFPTP
jgi:formylglycine-generating enzyme required for sulfatase activity